MTASIIAGDPDRTKVEYGVALPSGKIVSDSTAIDDGRGPAHIGRVYDAARAGELAALYNAHYRKVGAPEEARAVSRLVTTSYSDWAVTDDA